MINIQNIDDSECFKWSLPRYLNPAGHNSRRITKADKDFAKKCDFKGIKFPVKIRDIQKIEKNNSISISVFGYENKEKQPIYVSKKCSKKKHVDLLLIGEEGKRHYVLVKDFNTFMYDHTLHRGRKPFCCYCLQAFSTEELLKCHIKDCFKINGKQKIIMPKKGEYVQFRNYERKIKYSFIIYGDFESILVPEDNVKQNPEGSYTNKYYSNGYKLVCVDDTFSKPFYFSYLILQELGKLNLKINVIPNGIEKYVSFTINNKLNFIGSFQFLSSPLDSLVKNVGKDDFKY